MNDKIKYFMEYVSSHEELKAELKSVTEGKSKEEQVSNVLAFAKKHDMKLTKDDIAPDCVELDEDELETVGGGGGCGCAVYGSGKGDDLDCGCIGVGGGSVKDDKDLKDNQDPVHSQGGCLCCAAGAGATRRH